MVLKKTRQSTSESNKTKCRYQLSKVFNIIMFNLQRKPLLLSVCFFLTFFNYGVKYSLNKSIICVAGIKMFESVYCGFSAPYNLRITFMIGLLVTP